MEPEVEYQVRRLRDFSFGLLLAVHPTVEQQRWGEFSERKLANTLARRGSDEWARWGRARKDEQDVATFFAACARAIRSAYWSAALSPKVDCVQVAGLRRTYEPMHIGRNFFRAELWTQLDRMIVEGLDKIDQELLGWMSKTKVPFTPSTCSETTSASEAGHLRGYQRTMLCGSSRASGSRRRGA